MLVAIICLNGQKKKNEPSFTCKLFKKVPVTLKQLVTQLRDEYDEGISEESKGKIGSTTNPNKCATSLLALPTSGKKLGHFAVLRLNFSHATKQLDFPSASVVITQTVKNKSQTRRAHIYMSVSRN